MSRLSHVNKNLRMKAASTLAKLPPSEVVPLLLEQLTIVETDHRRAAVQALGMVGTPAVKPLISVLVKSDNIVERASCSKALAGVAMMYPRERDGFDGAALDALGDVVKIADPVTKIATVGCLMMLACDTEIVVRSEGVGEEGYRQASASESGTVGVERVPGNERAVQMLRQMLVEGDDIALAANVCGALAQIANCGGEERKAEMIAVLKSVVEKEDGEDDDETGFGYVKEMCKGHVEQLEGVGKC